MMHSFLMVEKEMKKKMEIITKKNKEQQLRKYKYKLHYKGVT